MKFEIKDLKQGGIALRYKSNGYNELIELGEIVLKKQNAKEYSKCWQSEEIFDYHGINRALRYFICNSRNSSNYFEIQRIVVIQMK